MRSKILLCTCVCLALSCSSSKKRIKENAEITNSISAVNVKQQDGVKIGNVDLNYEFDTREGTLKPIDNSKPMKIGDKEYYNVVIHTKDTKGNLKVNKKDSTALKSKDSTNVSQDENISLNRTENDKKGVNIIVKYLSFIGALVIIIYIVIFIINRMK